MGSATVQLLPLAIVIGLFSLFIISGLRTRKRQVSEYGFAGGYTSRVGIGAAIATNWMSAASFLGLAGMFYLKGYFAMAFVVGWTGGYVLLLVLMASQIRRFGQYTAPDFVAFRYESEVARTLAAVIAIAISVIYSVAQFKGIALLVSWLFGIDYAPAVILGASLVVSFVLISGTLGVARNQKLQYFVLIIAFIVPLMLLTRKLGYFWLLPQFGYGAAIVDLQQQFGFVWPKPFADGSPFAWFALCFTLMFGTAGLPHVLSRFYMVPGIRDARWGLVWGLFFIALIYWSAPAYAVLARLFEAAGGIPYKPSDLASADLVILSAATNGGLPVWVTGLLVAGGMSAAFSTVAGLMLTGAASFSYDIYPRLIRPGASESDKVYAAKAFFLVLALGAMLLALQPTRMMIAEIAALAFALAGNTIFPAFLLGIWWGRANSTGVITGMLVGVCITSAPLLLGTSVPIITTLLPATSSAFLGAPLVIVIIMLVSTLTAPPSQKIRSFLNHQVHDCEEE
ncbi:sodium:solute symporter family transporter [Pelotalea chapellei]|uniref:Cation acetate symporter n=1 Tax=Pelotalea chapellei TaxID=44671 RepID=A0ABS5UBY7_9BACT|nr:cation acetate symporter [Pelotalea chapellei]MBT1073161.1 cation acetate symporter [Pelotalea chapellei]